MSSAGRRKFKRLRHQTKGVRVGLRSCCANQSSSLTGSYVMATAEQRGRMDRDTMRW
jgi:hypothetical protein